MKTFCFVIALGLSTNFAQAQKLKAADVPAKVKDSFTAQFPGVKVESWEKEGANYEAEFDLDKKEMSVVLDPNGSLLETETEIAVSELPKNAVDYLNKIAPGKKIKEAARIIDPAGIVTYEAEVNEQDYLFDAAGNFLNKENDGNDKKGDD